MAEDNENTESEEEIPQKKEVIYVTRIQWLILFVLIASTLYFYIIWPKFASEKADLKEPGVYITLAQKHFDQTHKSHSFPRVTRTNTFEQVVWNYRSAEIADGELSSDDYFRWGYSSFEVAKHKYNKTIKGFVPAIRLLEKAKEGHHEGSKATLEKINFLLGQAYIRVKNYGKAIPCFEYLRGKKWAQEDYYRKIRKGTSPTPPNTLGAEPFLLQPKDLYQADLFLGMAHYKKGNRVKASAYLKDYMEHAIKSQSQERKSFLKGVPPESLQESVKQNIDPESKVRFDALSLLGTIYSERVRENFIALKKMRANQVPSYKKEVLQREWLNNLTLGRKYLEILFRPEYLVYDLSSVKLMLAEISYRLERYDSVLDLSRDYKNSNRSRKKEMEVWKNLAHLAKNKKALVGDYLAGIAGSDIDRPIQLAALVTLGDSLVARGLADRAMGDMLPNNPEKSISREYGVYLKATLKFDESEFDENPIIDKMTLIDTIAKKARMARDASDEETAIKLYAFLLEYFTIPKAKTVHQIAYLKAQQAFEEEKARGLNDKAKSLYGESGDFYLLALKESFDKEVGKDAYFLAGESYFLGHDYFRAHEQYGLFIEKHPDDVKERISQARHKMGVSALHRKVPTRFEDAIKIFIENIQENVRPVGSNTSIARSLNIYSPRLKEPMYLKGALDKILNNTDQSSRDIWAHKSLLELGKVFYAKHDYENAKRVFKRIIADHSFTPQAEIWRKALYQLAYLSFDEVMESKKSVTPWPKAIGPLEEVLFRYSVASLKKPDHTEYTDKVLFNELRRENARVKFLLANAYLRSKDDSNSVLHSKELLNQEDEFFLNKTLKKEAEALLAEGLYNLKKYKEAHEHYRRAHDRNREAFERPFYSLGMVDCLVALGEKDKAIQKLQMTKWEFQEGGFDENQEVLQLENKNLDIKYWVTYVDNRIAQLQR